MLRVLASLDVALYSHVYVAEDTGDEIFRPWLTRPGLRLQLGWAHVRTRGPNAW